MSEPAQTATLKGTFVDGASTERVTTYPSGPRAAPTSSRFPTVAGFAAVVRVNGPVALLYVGLVLLLWLPFGLTNGMGGETTLTYASETTSFWHGFFYGDPLRVYTSVFFNLGYHMSAWIGQGGSFVGYQIVYALLWWARGFLAYLIIRVLFPRHQLLAVLTGALVLVQASDHALNWVGTLNSMGMIFWMMLAFYAFVCALRTTSAVRAVIATLLAMGFAYMSLWTYQSALPMILAFPVIVLALRFGWSRRTLAITAAFYIPAVAYTWDSFRTYVISGTPTYEASVARSSFSPLQLLSDWWFNVESALKLTSWGAGYPAVTASTERILVSFGGGLVVTAGIAAVGYAALRRREAIMPDRRSLLLSLAVGLILVVLSFPAYLLLADVRSLWRTQFLAGIGAGLAFASLAGLLALVARRRAMQLAVAAISAGVVSYFGVYASFTAASWEHSIWERDRAGVAEVLGFAPRLKPDSLVVLVGVPKLPDPFGDNMWFDVAMRLAYPHDPVDGIYFYADGSPAPHENMVPEDQQWVFNGTGYATLLPSVPVANTVVIQYSASGRGHVDAKIPAFLARRDPWLAATYDPLARIVQGPVPAPASRRYGPIPGGVATATPIQ